jgi:hypothetical protein
MTMPGHRTRSVFDRYNVVEDGDVDRARELIERGIEAEMTQDVLDKVRDRDNSSNDKKAS